MKIDDELTARPQRAVVFDVGKQCTTSKTNRNGLPALRPETIWP